MSLKPKVRLWIIAGSSGPSLLPQLPVGYAVYKKTEMLRPYRRVFQRICCHIHAAMMLIRVNIRVQLVGGPDQHFGIHRSLVMSRIAVHWKLLQTGTPRN